MYCESCGMQLLAMQSTCGCGVPATRHWLQLISLASLGIAAGFNFFITMFILPPMMVKEDPSFLVRTWLWTSETFSLYGWSVFAVGLLVWAFWPHYGYEPEWEMQIARVLLILSLVLGIASLVQPYLPAEWAGPVREILADRPGLLPTILWTPIIAALGALCISTETRDSLLGDGRIFSLIALSLVFLVVVLNLVVLASL